MTDSNVGWVIGYPDYDIYWVSSIAPEKRQETTPLVVYHSNTKSPHLM